MDIHRAHLRGTIPKSQHKTLALACRLLAALEAMRSAMRSCGRLPQDNAPTTEADRYCLIFIMGGAASEAIRTIKQASQPNTTTCTRQFIEDDSSLSEIWDKITSSTPPTRLARLSRMRDKHWAHWDDEVSLQFIRHIAEYPERPPIMETADGGSILGSCSPWIREIWSHDLKLKFNVNTTGELVLMVQELMEDVQDIMKLSGELAYRILKKSGLAIEFEHTKYIT